MARRFSKTRPAVSRIGERAKPDPKGQPSYIRVDTVHQGDLNGYKGVYHINTVDEVTQWEILASVERISEAYLVLALREAAQIALKEGRLAPAAKWLDAQGFRTTVNKPFTTVTLYGLFCNQALIGETVINFKEKTVVLHH